MRRQARSGVSDRGGRSAVTGGAQMAGFVNLIVQRVVQAGIGREYIFQKKRLLDLPGFFRPTKEWDLLVVQKGQLVAAVEVKSQAGPSFGNNFNNRTEEAMGSALDFWTAYREGAFGRSLRPWLGYLFLLEDCAGSRKPVGVREPHFRVLSEFREASYAKRYELFCRKLVRERHYDAAAYITSDRRTGRNGHYREPAEDLRLEPFMRSLIAHVASHAEAINDAT